MKFTALEDRIGGVAATPAGLGPECLTPMLGLCFLLILFFTLSLRPGAPEGGLTMRTATPADRGGHDSSQLPTIQVRLRADARGNLSGMAMNQRPLADFDQLRAEIRAIVGRPAGADAPRPRVEVELDCDYNLNYEHTMKALTTISGYLADDGRTLVKLVDHVKFSPRRKP